MSRTFLGQHVLVRLLFAVHLVAPCTCGAVAPGAGGTAPGAGSGDRGAATVSAAFPSWPAAGDDAPDDAPAPSPAFHCQVHGSAGGAPALPRGGAPDPASCSPSGVLAPGSFAAPVATCRLPAAALDRAGPPRILLPGAFPLLI